MGTHLWDGAHGFHLCSAATVARHFRGPFDFVFWYATYDDVVHRHAWRPRDPAVPMFCVPGEDIGLASVQAWIARRLRAQKKPAGAYVLQTFLISLMRDLVLTFYALNSTHSFGA